MRSRDMLPDLLFFKRNSYDTFEQRKVAVRQAIASLSREDLASGNINEIVAPIFDRYSLTVPVLHEDQKHADREEVKLDVSQDQRRLIWDRSRPFDIDAMRITIWVPFEGDPELFRLQPSTFTFNPPRGEILGHEVGFVFVDTNPTPERVNAEFDGWLTSVKQYLSWHQQGMTTFNSDLQNLAVQAITARQQKLAATDNVLAGLNIPMTAKPKNLIAATSARPALKKSPSTQNTQRVEQYDCFVSYAGEPSRRSSW